MKPTGYKNDINNSLWLGWQQLQQSQHHTEKKITTVAQTAPSHTLQTHHNTKPE